MQSATTMKLPRTHFLLLFLLVLFVGTADAQLVINEYSCSNTATVADNGGEFEDWIELYNTSGSAVNLTGWHLSDKENNPLKWVFPGGTINANDRILIWCDSRDEMVGAELHTNFRVTQTRSEKIILSDPSGTIVDSLTVRPAKENCSRGRSTDGAANWSVFTTPSPNAANSGTSQEYTARPQFSIAPGFYTGSATVSLSHPNSNIEIRYTLDGSTPTAASTLYASPININATTVVRAAAFLPGNADTLSSFIETNTYFIDEVHTVKVISIAGDDILTLLNGTQFFPQASFELFEKDGTFMDETLAEFNEHGNDSWAYDQRGIDFITRDQFGYNSEIRGEIFNGKDRDGFQRLIIKGAASDNYPFENGGCHIRDAYVQSLSQIGDLKLDERSHESCVMYANGQYWGVYEIREKVDDIDFTDFYYDQGRGNVQMVKTWGGTWSEYGGPQAQTDWDQLVNFITTNDMSIQANYDSVKNVLNVGSLVDYFSLNSYVVCIDWLNWNTGWWRGRNPDGDKKKWRYFLWDMDAVFGHYINFTGVPDTSPDADPCQAENLNNPGGQGHTEIMTALLDAPEFEQLYVSRYIDLGNTVFSCEFMVSHLDSLVGIIDPEMQRHCNRWGGSYTQWQQNVQDLRNYILDRCVSVDDGLVDCYEVEGPYPVTFIVEPAGSPNTIQINSIEPDVPEYPFAGDWFGNIDLLLEANAGDGWVFDYWESANHTINPNIDAVDANTMLNGSDTIIAHFVQDSIFLTVLVDPPGSGEVSVDFTPIPSYPWSGYYLPNANIALEATPNPGWEFDNWTSNLHSMNPSNTNDQVFFTIIGTDTVVAHFREEPDNIEFRVMPQGAGTIDINGFIPTSYPHSDAYYPLDNVDLVAIANPNYDFSHWTASNHVFNPDDQTAGVSIVTSSTDTITAWFTEHPYLTVSVLPEGSGMVALNGQTLDPLPWESYVAPGSVLTIEGTPAANYIFDHWEMANHTVMPSVNDSLASFTITSADELIGHFRPLEAVLDMPNVFTPNGDGNNDVFAAKVFTNVTDANLVIFNRWGRTVCTVDNLDLENGWDGTCDGTTTEAGTYFYTVTYQDYNGETNTKEGVVTLVR